jgi:ethanolamine utilization microcompartment shell protein EutS
MASVYATSSGNWSSTAIWYTGSVAYNQVPQSGDVVYANGSTVTIDQNFNVSSINTTALAPAVAGGGFSITGSVTITGSINGGATNCVTCTAPSGSTVRISGSIAGSSTTGIYGFVHNGTGNIIVTGNINCGGGSISIGFVNNTSGSLTVNGILNSNTSNNREPVANNSTGTATVLTIRATLADSYVDPDVATGNVEPPGDSVDGTVSIDVTELKAAGSLLPSGSFVITSPVYSLSAISGS